MLKRVSKKIIINKNLEQVTANNIFTCIYRAICDEWSNERIRKLLTQHMYMYEILYIDVFDGGLSHKNNVKLAELPVIPEADANFF